MTYHFDNDRFTRHTPGPWRTYGRLVISTRDPMDPNCQQIAATNSDGAMSIEQAAANARLLAAAPELLEALEKCVRFGGLFPDLAEEARAAIARATGGTHE